VREIWRLTTAAEMTGHRRSKSLSQPTPTRCVTSDVWRRLPRWQGAWRQRQLETDRYVSLSRGQ
jgi:hypothetical protein